MTELANEPWQIPAAWTWTQFADVARIAQDLVAPSEVMDLPHIAPNHIESGTRRLLPHATVREDGVISAKQRFYPGQILYSKIRPYLRKAVAVDVVGVCSADVYPISPSEAIDRHYFLFWLVSEDFKQIVLPHQGRTLLPKINQEGRNRTAVPVPPPAEQRRIVAKLDALTARLARARAELDRVGLLTAALRLNAVAAAFRDRATRRVQLAELLESGPTNGWSPPSGDDAAGARTLKLTATTKRRVRLDADCVKRIYDTPPPSSSLWLRNGDVLIQRANSLEHVGATAIFDGPDATYIYPDLMMRIRIGDRSLRRLVWYYLNSAEGRLYFQQNATGTAGNMPKISGRIVREMPFPLPHDCDREQIVALLDQTFARAARLEAEAARARGLLDRLEAAILARAFRGELVPQDPNDEPASVLLDRIRAERAAAPKAGRKPRLARRL